MYALGKLRQTLQDHRFLVAFAALFGTSVVLGYTLGRAWSPDFDDPTYGPQAIQLMISRDAAQVAPMSFDKRLDSKSRLVYLQPSGEILRYVCGIASFEYDVSAGAVHRVAAPGIGRQDLLKRRGLHLDQVSAALVAGGTSSLALSKTLPRFTQLVREQKTLGGKAEIVSLGLLSMTSGFAVGFWWSYEAEPGCGAPPFQKALQDRVVWQGIANSRKPEPWTFRWDRVPGTVGPSSDGAFRITVDVPEVFLGERRLVPPESCQLYGTDTPIPIESARMPVASRLGKDRPCEAWTLHFQGHNPIKTYFADSQARSLRFDPLEDLRRQDDWRAINRLVLLLVAADEYELATRLNRLSESPPFPEFMANGKDPVSDIRSRQITSTDKAMALAELAKDLNSRSDDYVHLFPRPPWSR
jgi:hypothetical protein